MHKFNPFEPARDYDSLKLRFAAANAETQRAAKVKALQEYVGRRERHFTTKTTDRPKNSFADKLKSIAAYLKSESTHFALASLVLAGFVIGIGYALYVRYSEQSEASFARECSSNHLSHASNIVCYDGKSYVHTLNPDGTAKKAVLDWRVNRKLAD